MDLDLKDRIILANQYRILEKLNPDEADHYAQNVKILESGYALDYARFGEHFSEEMSVDDCREVRDILDMYRSLKNAYSELTDKNGIDPTDWDFRGFDGNDEGSQFSYASFLIEVQGRWRESKIPDINSHWPTLNRYRRMLKEWHASEEKHSLTGEDVRRILQHAA